MNQSDRQTLQSRRDDISRSALESEFVVALSLLENGDLARQLSEDFTDLIKAVQTEGKPGTLSFTMKVSPAGGKKLKFKAVPKFAPPRADASECILFADDYGNVYGADPDQMLLNFSAKKIELPPAKEVPVEVEAAAQS